MSCTSSCTIKDKYYEYRMTLSFEEQTKVKVPRELFTSWVETSLDQVDRNQRRNLGIRIFFEKCGLDPFDNDKVLLAKHLESLANEAVYNALIQGQKAVELL